MSRKTCAKCTKMPQPNYALPQTFLTSVFASTITFANLHLYTEGTKEDKENEYLHKLNI